MDESSIAKHYKRQQIEAATPGQIVVMLYDAAIESLKRAEEVHADTGPEKIERFHNHLIKCQNIITELTVSLDMESGGEIASNLFRLYDYMNRQLIDANISKKLEPIQEVQQLLGILRGAWEEVKDVEIPTNAGDGPVKKSSINIQG